MTIEWKKLNHLEVYLLLNSLASVLFLMFIDEGYYDFSSLGDLSNWTALFFYFMIILGIQVLLFRGILGRFQIIGKAFSLSVTLFLIIMMIKLGIEHS